MNRVIVIGCGGAGKTTLARYLGKKTGLPVVHLDQIWWSPGNWNHLEREDFDALLMKEMENEGVRFMNVNHVDKKRRAPIISAITMIIIMIATIALLVWANTVDPLPLVFIALIIAIPVVVIIGVLLALRDRMRQIEGGEEDAASKY